VIAVLTLLFGAGKSIDAKKKAYTDAKGAIDKSTRPKNVGSEQAPGPYLTPWLAYAKKFSDKKQTAWGEAWKLQKDLVNFPSSDAAPLQNLWQSSDSFEAWVKRFEGDRTTSNQLRQAYKGSLYLSQFDDLLRRDPKFRPLNGPLPRNDQDQPVTRETDMLLWPCEFAGGKLGFEQIMTPPMAAASSDVGGMGPRRGDGGGKAPPGPGNAGDGNAASGKTIRTLWDRDDPPTLEEVWIAQEDFWVKTELLRALKGVLDDAGKMRPGAAGAWAKVDAEPALPAKAPGDKGDRTAFARKRFSNRNWELDLIFEKGKDGNVYLSKESTLRNVSADRRTLALELSVLNRSTAVTSKGPLEFKLRQGNKEVTLEVAGERLAWGKSAHLKEQRIDSVEPDQPFEAQQMFDWWTSPLRRVDDLRLPAQSHRTAAFALKPGLGFKEEKKEDEGADAGGPSQPPGPPGSGGPAAGPKGGPGQAGIGGGGGDEGRSFGGAAAAASLTKVYKLDRNRYLAVTEQCRHLPLGVVVMVDQAAITDVLTALANSRLRFQITQVHYHRARDVRPGGGAARPQQGPGQGPRGPGIAGAGGDERPHGNGGQTAGGGDGDPNLVELTVYGIAALYERFPEKKDEKKEGTPGP
jgi:hypothetical protein